MAELNNVTWRLQSLERRMDGVEARTELLSTLRIEVREVKKDIEGLVEHQKERERLEAVRQAEQAREKKADRKWQVGTAIAVVIAVISAMAIIVPLVTQ